MGVNGSIFLEIGNIRYYITCRIVVSLPCFLFLLLQKNTKNKKNKEPRINVRIIITSSPGSKPIKNGGGGGTEGGGTGQLFSQSTQLQGDSFSYN